MANKFAAYVLSLLIGQLVLTTILAAPQQPKFTLPAPTGPYNIGRTSFHWIDETRPEKFTNDPNDRRELMVHIWYPASVRANNASAPYCLNYETIKDALPSYQKKFCLTLNTNSFLNAKFAENLSTVPVLVFSHGNESVAGLYSFLLEEMASHGYIVVAIDHPYEALVVGYPNGRVAKYIETNFNPKKFATPQDSFRAFEQINLERIKERALDASFVLDQLERVQNGQILSELKSHLSLNNIGIFGHSNGGKAAAWALHDKRFKAALNLDGHAGRYPFYLDENNNGPQRPFMYLEKFLAPIPEPSDEELTKRYKTTRQRYEENKAKILKEQSEVYDAMRRMGYYRITIKGATHDSFADSSLFLSQKDASKHEMAQRYAQLIRAYTLAFFDQQLLGKSVDLLNGKTTPPADVTVEIFKN